jgi:hypothetical protein
MNDTDKILQEIKIQTDWVLIFVAVYSLLIVFILCYIIGLINDI